MRERQVKFSAGELSPTLWGRTDLEQYRAGARGLTNWIPTPHGVLVNRAGTQHVSAIEGAVKIVPFVVDDDEKYLLVFRTYTGIQVWRASTTDPRHGFEFVKHIGAYLYPAITGMTWAQDGRVMTFCLGYGASNWGVRELEVDEDGNWTLRVIPYMIAPAFPTQDYEPHTDRYPRMRFLDSDEYLAWTNTDSTHAALPWEWVVTYVARDGTTGQVYETQGYSIWQYHLRDDPSWGTGTDESPFSKTNVSATHAVSADQPRTFWSCMEAGDELYGDASWWGGEHDVVIASRLYRGREGRYGLVGESTTDLIQDYGDTPDWARPPPTNGNMLTVDDSNQEPFCVTYFENRRYFANVVERPGTIWGSAVGRHHWFEEIEEAKDSDALEVTLKSKRSEVVKALVPREELLVFTTASVWVLTGVEQGAVLTPNSISAHVVLGHGCAAIQPAEVGRHIVYAKTVGHLPTVLVKKDGQYLPIDISLTARHLFNGYTIVDWAYAEHPYSVLWVVRSDGALLSCTIDLDAGVVAWAKHELNGDAEVTGVATLPEDGEDGVYLLVDRDGEVTLERFAYRLMTDIREAIFLDQSVSYNGHQTDAITWSTWPTAIGNAVTFNTTVSLVVDDVVRMDTDEDDENQEPFLWRVATDLGGGNYSLQMLNRGDQPGWVSDCTLSDWYVCATTVSGLSHLEGQTVKAVADGNVYEGLVVRAGSVTIGETNPAGVIHVGVAFNSDFESLNATEERGRQKLVKKAVVELEHTRGGQVGPDLDHLQDIKTRRVEHGTWTIPLTRVEVEVVVSDRWAKTGRVAFRQADPMPATILGITREYELGG